MAWVVNSPRDGVKSYTNTEFRVKEGSGVPGQRSLMRFPFALF